MVDGPTTANGPLHTPEADLRDRRITAAFATPQDARAARDALVAAGIGEDRVAIAEQAGSDEGVEQATAAPDQSLFGRLREAVLPDDSQTAIRAAARDNDAILTLVPRADEVDKAVEIIQAARPTRFDADLERWRNKA